MSGPGGKTTFRNKNWNSYRAGNSGRSGNKKIPVRYLGDTVNLAARMEQSGVPGKINISQYTYEIIKGDFTCIYRGKIQAKNKGEIDMYFVETSGNPC